MGSHAILQEIFLTQGSNPPLLCLLHWQVGSSPLAPAGSTNPGGTLTQELRQEVFGEPRQFAGRMRKWKQMESMLRCEIYKPFG